MNLRVLLLFNLLLQALDGVLTHYSLSLGAYEANPLVASAMEAWGVLWGLSYYKVLASLLLVLVYTLRRGREALATQGLTITASVYLCLQVVSLCQLSFSY
ncbi:MAG: DUF5658 family protein [Candidatus Binatia bacterium]